MESNGFRVIQQKQSFQTHPYAYCLFSIENNSKYRLVPKKLEIYFFDTESLKKYCQNCIHIRVLEKNKFISKEVLNDLFKAYVERVMAVIHLDLNILDPVFLF